MMAQSTLLVAVILSLVVGIAAQCTLDGRQCIEGQATCISNECVCNNPPYTQGDGTFACYQQNRAFAELRNDPTLSNFNDERVNFPYPCRFLFSHIIQQLKDKNKNVIGNCEFEIYAYNAKNRGKFYAKGFDIALRITYDAGPVVEISARKFGWAEDGVNQFTRQGTFGAFLPDGPFGNDDIEYNDPVNGVRIVHLIDEPNDQVVLDVAKCGLRITFAPYDYVLKRDQPRVPGLSVSINCAHHPRFLSSSSVMATGRVDLPGGQSFNDLILPGLNLAESILDRAFRNPIIQSQPDANSECTVGHDLFLGCTGVPRNNALNNCYWLLTTERLIRCVDETSSGNSILSIFNLCVSGWCNNNADCDLAVSIVVNENCDAVINIPQLPAFIVGDLCP